MLSSQPKVPQLFLWCIISTPEWSSKILRFAVESKNPMVVANEPLNQTINQTNQPNKSTQPEPRVDAISRWLLETWVCPCNQLDKRVWAVIYYHRAPSSSSMQCGYSMFIEILKILCINRSSTIELIDHSKSFLASMTHQYWSWLLSPTSHDWPPLTSILNRYQAVKQFLLHFYRRKPCWTRQLRGTVIN